MPPQELSSRRIQEVRETLASYTPKLRSTDRVQLARLAQAVLASVDVRDLRATPTEQLLEQLESILSTIAQRGNGDVNAVVRVTGENEAVVESCVADQPFLVSALRALFVSEGLEVRNSLNAVPRLRRDKKGGLLDFGTGTRESIIRIELRCPEGVPEGLEGRVRQRLELAQAMVRDFDSMKRRIQSVADDAAGAAAMASGESSVGMRETEGLLRWLCDENYVLFSVEEYTPEGELESSFGVASVAPPTRDVERLKRAASGVGRAVLFDRSRDESPVHRAGKPGRFLFRRVNRRGEPIGSLLIEGLFTYKALHTPPEEVPYLRMLLRDMLATRDVDLDSHRGKSITNAFNSLPLEYLLAENREDVWELTDTVLRAETEGGSEVHIKVGEDRRFAFAFVCLPKTQFSEQLRLELQEMLQGEFGANYSDYGIYIDRYENAIVHFYFTGAGPLPEADTDNISRKVREMARGWEERLREAVASVDAEREEELFDLYVEAFNAEHRRRAAGVRLAGDVECLERIRAGNDLECSLFVSRTSDHPGSLNLRVFTREALTLSDMLPVLHSFGFKVIDEYTRPVRVPHLPEVAMHTFRLDVRRERHRQVLARAHHIEHGIRDVFTGRLGRDRLNNLIVRSNLSPRDVEVLRAYVAYLHQLRAPFAPGLLRTVLVNHPSVAQALRGVLSARFDVDPNARPKLGLAQTMLDNELRAVNDFTADRALRAVAAVVRATVRTNAWQPDRPTNDAMAFKVEAQKLPFGPEPKPYREIWVYHPELQGVHLRGGKVARGGLRFSDRPDDFRTEIHGLMATQMVKNVLIVPMGAKGGFVLRNPPAGRRELREAGDRYYQVFIRALLSITDNVVEGDVQTPQGIRHAEGDDPYLVVAADKGTAHLSDTANRISMEHGFWLDDAFASGGSHGYDHKKTGITARGAWEATKRSFRELGIDPESDPITAIGVGDMSGDVFGNGLLRTKTVRLQAAFNHMHIFIDPDPDPEVSYEERLRLFQTPGTAWSDYDAAKISEGGGVWERNTKEVPLSPKAREMLGIDPDADVGGEEVIKAIMCMAVDLVWMGGIGTYVKSRSESHADVGDKANDPVRVDAKNMHCRVFAEGANLAITERGRVELARRGVQNYTAFLDNSGGVDVSDHEVNIKILFSPLIAAGSVSRDERNAVLEKVEDEVCEMVLDNNRAQSRMVSYDVMRSGSDPWRYARTMQHLAAEIPFDPEAFSMPTEEEIGNRFRRGEGLFKCEAAVLGSHAKMLAYRELLADEPLPEELVRDMVSAYFPASIREVAGEGALDGHLLRREIATTMVVNRIVDNAGASFFPEVQAATGRTLRNVAAAYLQAVSFGGAETVLEDLYALEDKHRQRVVYEAMGKVQHAVEDATCYLLGPLAEPVGDAERAAAERVFEGLDERLPPAAKGEAARRVEELVEARVPEPLARRIVRLTHLREVLDSLRLARVTGRSPEEALDIRVQVAQQLRMPALQRAMVSMRFESPWDGPAVAALSRQLDFHVHKLTRLVRDGDIGDLLADYGLRHVPRQVASMVDGGIEVAALVMLDGQLRRLLPPMPDA